MSDSADASWDQMTEHMTDNEEAAWSHVRILERSLALYAQQVTHFEKKEEKLRDWCARFADPDNGGNELRAIIDEEPEIDEKSLPPRPPVSRGVARMKAHFADCAALGITDENYDERVRETNPEHWPDYLRDKPASAPYPFAPSYLPAAKKDKP